MEIFGGFIMLLWMVGFFLTIIWFILPFVIFGIKARTDETLAKLKDMDTRLASIEKELSSLQSGPRNICE